MYPLFVLFAVGAEERRPRATSVVLPIVSERAAGEKGAGSPSGRWAEHRLCSDAVLTSTPLAGGRGGDETTTAKWSRPELSSRHSPIAVAEEKQPAASSSSSFDAAARSAGGGHGEVSEYDDPRESPWSARSLLGSPNDSDGRRTALQSSPHAPDTRHAGQLAAAAATAAAAGGGGGGGSARETELEVRLRAQGEVNRELKRLLVASVGSGLQQRLEQLAAEKAGLARDLDRSLDRLAASDEELDRVAIACDVWRSKFLASRLMLEELAGRGAEGRAALRRLLAERARLARDVVACHLRLSGALESLGETAAARGCVPSTQPDGRELYLHGSGETETSAFGKRN